MEDELEGFLNTEAEAPTAEVETPGPVDTPEVAEQPEETPSGPVRDEKGRFAPKGEKEEAASPAAVEAPLDHAALIGERRRRQEAEDRLRQMEEAIRSNQQAPQQQAPQAPQNAIPDRWEDPEGYDQWLVQQATQAATQAANEQFQRQRIEASAIEEMQRIPDYQEKIAVFEQMASANPALMQEMARSPNPAEYAYNMAKTQVEISQYGGLDGLINARVQEALKAHTPAAQAPIPETLASEQSARATGGNSGLVVPSLDDIIKR
jgi:hypothetical protein